MSDSDKDGQDKIERTIAKKLAVEGEKKAEGREKADRAAESRRLVERRKKMDRRKQILDKVAQDKAQVALSEKEQRFEQRKQQRRMKKAERRESAERRRQKTRKVLGFVMPMIYLLLIIVGLFYVVEYWTEFKKLF